MSNDIPHFTSLPLTTFRSTKRKQRRLKFQDKTIFWDYGKPPYESKVLPIENVIAVNPNSGGNDKQFKIHYGKSKHKNKWKHKSMTLNHSDPYQVSIWVACLQTCLSENSAKRPTNMLVFVNPYGGRKMAIRTFEKRAKPLFAIAGMDFTVIVSQKKDQIRDLIIDGNFEAYDSIGCVGGDGTVSEVLNGLILRECRLKGVDPHDQNRQLPKPNIPVGIIPGGSTDTTAYCVYGTTDATTAAIHIILGDTLGVDLVSVHDDTSLLKLYIDVMSYGFLGDVAHFSEDLRWMGIIRYDYTGFKRLISNKGYEGELTILIDPSQQDPTKCYGACKECFSKRRHNIELATKVIEGKFFMVSGANVSCAGRRNPQGLAPYCHLGDGFLYMVIVYHNKSIFQSLQSMRRFLSTDFGTKNVAQVEAYRAAEFRFRARNGSKPGRWSCDGEVIESRNIRARVHRQLLTVFSRGFNPPLRF